MLVVFTVCAKDVQLLHDLLNWIEVLGPCKDHIALICADAATPFNDVMQAKEIAERIFKGVQVVTNDVSVVGWIEGPKSLFLTASAWAKHANMPFLQMDSDAIPLKTGWLDVIEAGYRAQGNPYMGHLFNCDQPGLPPLLMSPIAVYPAKAHDELKNVISKPGFHWDVEMTPIVVTQCADLGLIHHLFGEMGNPPTFAEQAVFGTAVFQPEQIKKTAVIFHRNKDGTLIDLLRKRMGLESLKKKPLHQPMSFFQMGRYGDLLMLLPAFKYWADQSGMPVNVWAATEFGHTLEGASYVTPRLIPLHWSMQAGAALSIARQHSPDVICCMLHGTGLHCPPDNFKSYSLTMWNRCDLMDKYDELLPVIDRRNKYREAALLGKFKTSDKPLLLVNFKGLTSPMGSWVNIAAELCKLSDRCELVNLNACNAHRVFDLLGLMDRAVGLLTVDTMTLHLAPASKIPYIAYTRDDGQSGSIPKGNCVMNVGYSKADQKIGEIMNVVKGWLN